MEPHTHKSLSRRSTIRPAATPNTSIFFVFKFKKLDLRCAFRQTAWPTLITATYRTHTSLPKNESRVYHAYPSTHRFNTPSPTYINCQKIKIRQKSAFRGQFGNDKSHIYGQWRLFVIDFRNQSGDFESLLCAQ